MPGARRTVQARPAPAPSRRAGAGDAEARQPGDQVQSLMRGLALLEAFADADGRPLGLGELAQRTGLSPSTAHRLLASLHAEGYVTRDHETNRYLLGHRIAGTAATIQQRTGHLRALARPHLEAIAARTGETTNLVVLDETLSVYIDKVDGSHALRMAMRIGSTFPAHTSASAKAILAHQPDDRALRRIFAGEPLRKLARNTITTARAFRAALAAVRAQGYAVEHEELEVGVSCVAAPILDGRGIAIAAISVPGPTARIVMPSPGRIGELVRSHAREVSQSLGSRPAA
ncbi:MAG TPA: IclR family transcriptional regulator [Dongiaceae bacterium]|nr:IclR family transcriptional regulator [Dongiaceae bacterium]